MQDRKDFHEQSADFMAIAYGRLTGEPGICHGTAGPGVCNLVSGTGEAFSACTPLIALCPTVDISASHFTKF